MTLPHTMCFPKADALRKGVQGVQGGSNVLPNTAAESAVAQHVRAGAGCDKQVVRKLCTTALARVKCVGQHSSLVSCCCSAAAAAVMLTSTAVVGPGPVGPPVVL
jgi:hypothetical protein